MPLPPNLLRAIAAPHGGQVVLVLGAGSSVEDPTNLPLSRDCSIEAHRRLVADRILQDGQCPNPEDLSQLADVVKAQQGGRQAELVARLPQNEFLLAQPNTGHLIAAALLREHALSAIMTLNFDLAMSCALADIGATEVSVIAGPEDHRKLGILNLIYIHRNANAPAESWILTTTALTAGWVGQWEEVIARRVLASAVTVFAGLGTPAGVLVETVKRIRESSTAVTFYVVGPANPDQSVFLREMRLLPDAYIQSGWSDFARDLGARLTEEHRAQLESACARLIREEHWTVENLAGICARFASLGLLDTGKVRARWMLKKAHYEPARDVDPSLIADLILAVALVERVTGRRAVFSTDGTVEFRNGDNISGVVVLASGRGTRRWLSLEADLHTARSIWERRDPQPMFAVVAGCPAAPAHVSPPDNLIADYPEDGVVPSMKLKMINVDSLRLNEATANELVS